MADTQLRSGGASRERRSSAPLPPLPKRHRMKLSHNKTAWTFVSPFVAIFVVFTGLPALMALVFSFTNIASKDMRDPFAVDFVFFDTFAKVLSNGDFLKSLGNTGVMVVLGVPLTIGIGLALALVLNDGIRRLKSTYRAAFYLPVITNVVAAAVIWQYAFTLNGPLNSLLANIGIQGPNWLGDGPWAMSTVISLAVWRNVGTCMVLFLAGLQAIPEDVYEAAALDGAGFWKRLSNMTLPLLRPTTLLITVLMTVAYMNIFDEPYLVTKGGPVGSTKSVALWVYEQFGFGNIANAMAGSWILLLLIAVVSVIQLRLLRSKT